MKKWIGSVFTAYLVLALSNVSFPADISGIELGKFFTLAQSIETEKAGKHYNPAVGDLDGDGYLDFIAVSSEGPVIVYKNNGKGLFTEFDRVSTQENKNDIISVVLDDVDGDGDLDLITGHYGESTLIFKNDGKGHFSYFSKTPVGNTWRSLVSGDVDNDGDADLVEPHCFGKHEGKFFVFQNDGNGNFTILQEIIPGGGMDNNAAVMTDIDGDGVKELITGGFHFPTSIWENDGSGVFDVKYMTPLKADVRGIGLADVNNDGNIDFIRAQTAGPNAIFVGDGKGEFTLFSEVEEVEKTETVLIGDLDNDGDVDCIALNGWGKFYDRFYRNDGNGHFTSSGISPEAEDSWAGILADLDNDGDLDYIVTGGHYTKETVPIKVFHSMVAMVGAPNTLPQPPVELSSHYDQETNTLILKWGAGSDKETPDKALYYNLRVGTSPGANDVVSGVYGTSMFGSSSGMLGNMQESRKKLLKGLPAGTYYWSVQAIDSGLRASNWSEEQKVKIE